MPRASELEGQSHTASQVTDSTWTALSADFAPGPVVARIDRIERIECNMLAGRYHALADSVSDCGVMRELFTTRLAGAG